MITTLENAGMTRRIVRFLDLVDDADLIEAYKDHHRPGAAWPEVLAHLKRQGFLTMEIWSVADRLVMIAEVAPGFPLDVETPATTLEWERLMDRFQRRLPGAPADVKWVDAERIFQFDAETGA